MECNNQGAGELNGSIKTFLYKPVPLRIHDALDKHSQKIELTNNTISTIHIKGGIK